jgi:hypothetical protein
LGANHKIIKIKQEKTDSSDLVLYSRTFKRRGEGIFWQLCALQSSGNSIMDITLEEIGPKHGKRSVSTKVNCVSMGSVTEYVIDPYGDLKTPRIFGRIELSNQSCDPRSIRVLSQRSQLKLPRN